MLSKLLVYTEKNEATFPQKGYRGLNIFGKIKFTKILLVAYCKVNLFHFKALLKKECYIGPFIGEFGNFLLHILPYLSYLHSKGVKIKYCGLEIHKPFLVNESGSLIIDNSVFIRDFFHDVKPSGNSSDWFPKDVSEAILHFNESAMLSKLPFIDLSDSNLYWFVYRNWQLNGKQKTYDLSKLFSTEKKNKKCVIFPRKMTSNYTKNNGGKIDYVLLANSLAKEFDEVVFIGHPEFSDIDEQQMHANNVRFSFTGGNLMVLKESATADLIISPHSGAVHVGGYTKTPVLMIFKGNPPIQGLDDTIRFRKNFNYNEIDVVFSEAQLIDFVKKNYGK